MIESFLGAAILSLCPFSTPSFVLSHPSSSPPPTAGELGNSHAQYHSVGLHRGQSLACVPDLTQWARNDCISHLEHLQNFNSQVVKCSPHSSFYPQSLIHEMNNMHSAILSQAVTCTVAHRPTLALSSPYSLDCWDLKVKTVLTSSQR